VAKRAKRRPASSWPWWKVVPLTVVVFGFFGAMLGFLPPVSSATIRLGLLLSVPVIIAVLWSWWTYNWWARLAAVGLWTLQFLAIAMRGWSIVLGFTWLWLAPILSAYILAWAMPALNPRLSAILWGEQVAPRTRVGRTVLGLALAVGPSAGVIGASVGMFGSRFGGTDMVILAIAALSSAVAIGFAFAFAYQVWPDRPWATQAASSKQA